MTHGAARLAAFDASLHCLALDLAELELFIAKFCAVVECITLELLEAQLEDSASPDERPKQ